ncbi:MAG: hypothetical protein AAB663_03365 [Patescibacteria group bacterium]
MLCSSSDNLLVATLGLIEEIDDSCAALGLLTPTPAPHRATSYAAGDAMAQSRTLPDYVFAPIGLRTQPL